VKRTTPLPPRSGPIRRSKAVRRKRSTPRRSGRVRDEAYLRFVRSLPCLFGWSEFAWTGEGKNCRGVTEADHAGPRPVGRKADDDSAIPLCTEHHRQRTDYRGVFAEHTAATMRWWCDEAIARTRAEYAKRFDELPF